MPENNVNINAEVIAVYPNKVIISVDDLDQFAPIDEQTQKLRVGSLLEISDNENNKLIAIIENYSIVVKDPTASNAGQGQPEGQEPGHPNTTRKYRIEANPIGTLCNETFCRGGNSLTIPPTSVKPASMETIKAIYLHNINDNNKFKFAQLANDTSIEVPVDGNKFFNKHFAIVGSTGSGKSCTVAKIIQEAINQKNGGYTGLNNSHVVLFDIHGEYKSAFPDANFININNIKLPYWLLDGDELEELFLDTGDRNNYNQSSVLRRVIIENKKKFNTGIEINFGTPVKFDINEVLNCLINIQNETTDYNNSNCLKVKNEEQACVDLICNNTQEKYLKFFHKIYDFQPTVRSQIKSGIYADGTLDKFIDRFENKVKTKRFDFLFGNESRDLSFEEIIERFIGYKSANTTNPAVDNSCSNITIFELGAIPFEVLSITVSLISRILFEFGYFYKKHLEQINSTCKTPILVIYEEAHKYAPRSELSKYKSSKTAIERLAKEGRKYGVTIGIVSQRPSEISETIFSQCNTFVAMRLTNPDDQAYVKKLLPDTIGNLTDILPGLQTGEALLIGESIVVPSLVSIDRCDHEPSSNDIPYIEIWKKNWETVEFDKIIDEWKK